MRKLRCPNCKYTQFVRKAEEIIEMIDNGESIHDELVSDTWETTYEYYCSKCDADLTDIELR